MVDVVFPSFTIGRYIVSSLSIHRHTLKEPFEEFDSFEPSRIVFSINLSHHLYFYKEEYLPYLLASSTIVYTFSTLQFACMELLEASM